MAEYISEHFKRSEFTCGCGCGLDTVDTGLIYLLELVRARFAVPVTVNSGCRCLGHNDRVGGSAKSQHLIGRAADIVVAGIEPSDVADYLDSVYPNQYGLGRYDTFTHIDSRGTKARWQG